MALRNDTPSLKYIQDNLKRIYSDNIMIYMIYADIIYVLAVS